MKTYSGIIKLVCLVIVLPLFTWIFALRETVHLYTEKNKMQKENLGISLRASQNQQQQVQRSSSRSLLSNGKILQLFADSMSKLEINMINYTPELIDSESDCKLYLGELTLSGKYIDLVKMISIIEQAHLPIKLVSLSFNYDRKERKPSSFITMVMFVEQIEY